MFQEEEEKKVIGSNINTVDEDATPTYHCQGRMARFFRRAEKRAAIIARANSTKANICSALNKQLVVIIITLL